MRPAFLALALWWPAAAFAAGAEDAPPPRKKLIAAGWDAPDSARLLKHLALMEKTPFDGVIVQVSGRAPGGREVAARGAFTRKPWKREWFAKSVAELKACRSRRLTDNFIIIGANPGDVDWFDDAGWAAITEHWRIAAWIAREGGLRGILFDPEPYTPPHAQFGYRAQSGRRRRSFAAYSAKARERGRQVMAAAATVYPDLTLFSYFMNSITAPAAEDAAPQRTLARSRYGLLPAFIDGWLDAAPPALKFVDGCENAYLYNSEGEFIEAAARIRDAGRKLVAPENREKYRAQVQVGFGLHLDAYWLKKGRYVIDGRGGPKVERLRENAAAALRLADEYVWIYGEQFRWWPTPKANVRPRYWPEALPGSAQALEDAAAPYRRP